MNVIKVAAVASAFAVMSSSVVYAQTDQQPMTEKSQGMSGDSSMGMQKSKSSMMMHKKKMMMHKKHMMHHNSGGM